jgi:twinfilin-like protein
MSTYSGIGVTPELAEAFLAAVDSKNIRAIKVSIRDGKSCFVRVYLSAVSLSHTESLVHEGSINVHGSFEEDLATLQEILEDDMPAYLLVRLDDPSSYWLIIYYVPDSAKVRDKVWSITLVAPHLFSPTMVHTKDASRVFTTQPFKRPGIHRIHRRDIRYIQR